MSIKKIAIISGTRPEAIKLAPVFLALKSHGAKVDYIKTGQHSKLHDQVTNFFKITHSVNDCIIPNKKRDLSTLSHELIRSLNKLFKKKKYTDIIIQGDTASAFCGAHVAFLNKLKIFHIESGLRTKNLKEPFPEEAFRKLISIYANINFSPTTNAFNNLIEEGICPKKILKTGNTVVDALRIAEKKKLNMKVIISEIGKKIFQDINENPFLLLTVHRRENHGRKLTDICEAIKSFSHKSKTRILCPIHPNPDVYLKIKKNFLNQKRIYLVNPLSYQTIIWVMKKCKFIVSDSGGLQEEAPSFNKRVIILRNKTERPEILDCGLGKISGTNASKLLKILLETDRLKQLKKKLANPFGNGYSANKISKKILNY